MRACWLKWVGRDWSISADYIWLNYSDANNWLSVGVGVVMSVVLSNHHRRRHILLVAVACLCVLLGGPPYAAGADSLTIAGQTYDEPGVSGPGWAARTLLLLAADRVRTAASLACTPPMASLPWTPPGWTRPAP